MMDELKRALQVLAGIATNGDPRAQIVGGYLLLINELVEEGQEFRGKLRDLTAEIEQMKLEGRNPTDEELVSLEARSQAARSKIAENKAALEQHEGSDGENDTDDES
jgi:hypothetical protein